MRRDSLFFKLFQQFPALLFELLDTPPPNANAYGFDSVAVKEPSFTIDGVFLPPASDPPGIVYFCEVQFQKDEQLYERLFGETALYFYRNRQRFSDWQVVVIYPSRRMEQSTLHPYRVWLASEQMHRIYLDELGAVEDLPLGIALMVLTILEEQDAPQVARDLLARSQEVAAEAPEVAEGKRRVMMEMISTIIIYKFTHLSREEVEVMLDMRLEETRVYREAREEGEQIGLQRGEQIGRQQGRQEGEQIGRQQGEQIGRQQGEQIGRQQEAANLIERLLGRRLRQELPKTVRDRLSQFGVEPLEDLAEALLDFTTLDDLNTWLHSYQQRQQTSIDQLIPRFTQQLGQEPPETLRDRLFSLSLAQLADLGQTLTNFTTVTDLETWLQARCP